MFRDDANRNRFILLPRLSCDQRKPVCWTISKASKCWHGRILSSVPLSSSTCGGLWRKLLLSIRSDLLPWFPRQVRGWPSLLLDHPRPWSLRHPLQLHFLWNLRPDGHGGAPGRQQQPGVGALRLAQPSEGARERHRRLCHSVLLLWPHQPGPGICSALPR